MPLAPCSWRRDTTGRRATADVAGADADADAAMVNHWFGGKEGLFQTAMDPPLNAAKRAEELLAGDDGDGLPDRIVEILPSMWEGPEAGPVMIALLRRVLADPQQVPLLRGHVAGLVLAPFASLLATHHPDDTQPWLSLTASHLLATMTTRHVLQLEPFPGPPADRFAGSRPPDGAVFQDEVAQQRAEGRRVLASSHGDQRGRGGRESPGAADGLAGDRRHLRHHAARPTSRFPGWALDVSPRHPVPVVPASHPWTPEWVLTAIVLAILGVGFAGFRHRDVMQAHRRDMLAGGRVSGRSCRGAGAGRLDGWGVGGAEPGWTIPPCGRCAGGARLCLPMVTSVGGM